ncbi:MAG: hypothetical protein CVU33_17600 [Betaproteobacteria bacterium HGW-Betaproteobacteria-6]|jgi:hypothetical protein|nr:MAG: hypothetical protein CVU33_17600 [Betaproteobacteria bacterium HGW-Betaproteobacteria-6]
MHRLTLTSLALLSTAAYAEAPWGEVDLSIAPALHEKACTSCHTRMYGSDGSKMYTRDGRMLSNKLELLQRVSSCNATVSAGWFPEEEGSVAAWLNQRYYHFEN